MASEKIAEVIEEGKLTDMDEIVQEVTELIQAECDEILVRDEDQQVIEKIIEAAMNMFLANSDLGGADGDTGDRIVGVVWEHMEEIAMDWFFDAYTSMDVVDDLIEEATDRANDDIDAILAGTYEDEDGPMTPEEGRALAIKAIDAFLLGYDLSSATPEGRERIAWLVMEAIERGSVPASTRKRMSTSLSSVPWRLLKMRLTRSLTPKRTTKTRRTAMLTVGGNNQRRPEGAVGCCAAERLDQLETSTESHRRPACSSWRSAIHSVGEQQRQRCTVLDLDGRSTANQDGSEVLNSAPAKRIQTSAGTFG